MVRLRTSLNANGDTLPGPDLVFLLWSVTAANCAPASSKLVVTCGDGAELLEPIEEALDQIAFTIECEVALPLDVSVGLGRNDPSDSTLGESFDERIGVISFVANQGLWVGVLD